MFNLRMEFCNGDPANTFRGWRMIDRFGGFRYELSGEFNRSRLTNGIIRKADANDLFGWVQTWNRTKNLVGEVRGLKEEVSVMQAWLLQKRKPSFKAVIRPYPDTKIRYHFASFKHLTSSRTTCFEDSPHKCTHAEERRIREEL
jgi:hypothetical protein